MIQPVDFLQQPWAVCLLVPLLVLMAFAIYAGVAFAGDAEGRRRRTSRTREIIDASGVDGMTMMQFREYVRKLLAHQGYVTEVPTVASADDIGTDLVATKDGRRTSVVVMRYSKALSPRVVDEAHRNKAHYQCEAAMVVTNGSFRKDALEAAAGAGCTLIDRDALAEWVLAYQPTIAGYL
jgi:HJR/Mrr/RecB family endonuclease